MSLAQIIKNSPNQFAPGHNACAGCAFPSILRTVMAASEKSLVVSNATGCMEVTSTSLKQSAWQVNYIHSAFENASATISGVESAQRFQEKNNRNPNFNFLAIGGDGASYDIGLQSLSGALERGHKFVYLCYDNEGYMNTGGQRSGSTPFGASTSTEPGNSKKIGKKERKKDLFEICIAHGVTYAAKANVANLTDLFQKAQKAFSTSGPAFILVFSPCITVWGFPEGKYTEIARLAVETRFWPIVEFESGKYKLNYSPKNYVPVEEYLKTQNRFKHLFKNGKTSPVVSEIQREVDLNWSKLLERTGK